METLKFCQNLQRQKVELLNIIRNIITIGTLVEVKSAEGKAMAKANICGRITDFLPIVSMANSFKKHFIPARVGEQVLILCPYAESNSGIILRGIFNKECLESAGNENKEVITYEDGVSFSYDCKTSTLEIKSPKAVNIHCQNASIKAQSIQCDSPSIDLGIGGQGVVTKECICAFTGAPHPHASQNTRSKI